MTREEKNYWIQAPTIAYYSGFGGVEIKSIEYGINDYAVVVSNAFVGKKKVHRVLIRYNKNGGSFKVNDMTIPMDACLRN